MTEAAVMEGPRGPLRAASTLRYGSRIVVVKVEEHHEPQRLELLARLLVLLQASREAVVLGGGDAIASPRRCGPLQHGAPACERDS